MPTKDDLILGRVAIERGFITDAQLNSVMKDLNATKSLGNALVERGMINQAKLNELVAEREKRIRTIDFYEQMSKAELDFGQLLVKHNKATQNQVNKCLDIQQKMAESGKGPIPRLGELLVDHGYVDSKTVQEILKIQKKDILVCTKCGKQLNVIGLETDKAYKCPKCAGPMIGQASLKTLKADETTYGFELPNEDIPPSALQ